MSRQREGFPNQDLVMAEGAVLKPQHEEELVGRSFSAGRFAGQKEVRREEKHCEGTCP